MSFTKEIEKQTLPIPCPECGRKVKKRIEWIKRNKQLICICGAIIALDTKQLFSTIKGIEKKFALLDKTFKNLKIKL